MLKMSAKRKMAELFDKGPWMLALFGAGLGLAVNMIAGRYAQQGHIWRHGGAENWLLRPADADDPLYKWVAVAAGAVLAFLAWHMAVGKLHLALLLGTGGVLLLASLIDARTQLLPRPLNLAFAALGITEALLLPAPLSAGTDLYLFAALAAPPSFMQRLLGGLIAFAALMLVKLFYARLRRRDGLGLGDVWLFAALAFWIGPLALPWLLSSAALAALAGTLLLAAIHGQLGTTSRHQRLAFGPWLALAGWALICAQRL
jgi:prepilin signal peptidase PulO-like enzyme (type II secretory pathway)